MEFTKLLPPEKQRQLAELNEYYEGKLIQFRNMDTKNLVVTVKYFMTQMKQPKRHKDYDPTYDATFWLILLPEMIRRLKNV